MHATYIDVLGKNVKLKIINKGILYNGCSFYQHYFSDQLFLRTLDWRTVKQGL